MKRILLLVTTCLLAGCQVEYHPYDTRVDGETGVNAKNMTRIEASCAGKQEIRFAMISDTRVGMMKRRMQSRRSTAAMTSIS